MKFRHATHFRLRNPISNPLLFRTVTSLLQGEMQMSFTAIYLLIILFSLPLPLPLSKTEGVREHPIYFVVFVAISGDSAKLRHCCPLIL